MLPAGSIGSSPYLEDVHFEQAQIVGTQAIDKIGEKAKLAALELCADNPSLCINGVVAASEITASVRSLTSAGQ